MADKVFKTLFIMLLIAGIASCSSKKIIPYEPPPAYTATVTRTVTSLPGPAYSWTATLTLTVSYTMTKTAVLTVTGTASAVYSATHTPSVTASHTETLSATASASPTESQTASLTPTHTYTCTVSPTLTVTRTATLINTVSCTGKTTGAGNYTRTTTVGGNVRQYLVHVPASYSPGTGVPLVLNFHGGQGSALDQLVISGMNAKSNSSGFIVVYPDGYGNTQTWNGGGCCGEARFYNIDDVQFTRQILDEMQAEFCIDTDRIFACGHSNGGIMSYRLACELSDRIAAIGSVGGGIGDVNPTNGIVYYTCSPARSVPIMHLHGLQDLCYPFSGGYGAGISNTDFVSIPHTIEDWRVRNGCGPAAVQTYSNGTASCVSYRQGCADGAEVVLCADTDAGHNWMGSSIYPSGVLCGGVTTTAIVANDMLWEFFTQHPMP